MIVVSDTSPLNYLVLIDLQHILPELFERILIPAAVRDELQSAGEAPEAIERFMAAAPAWLETRQVSEVDPKLQHLDRGEREAITLAASLSAGSVLIDEKKGRLAARESGLAASLGILPAQRLFTLGSGRYIRTLRAQFGTERDHLPNRAQRTLDRTRRDCTLRRAERRPLRCSVAIGHRTRTI